MSFCRVGARPRARDRHHGGGAGNRSAARLRRVAPWLAATWLGALAPAQTGPDFAAEVLPILARSCASCHGAPRTENGRERAPKGELRLDGKGWILKGGASGPVVVPGAPEHSRLLQLVSLPPDDRDRMPQRGDPLAPAEQEVIRRWIAAGAEFGGWTGAPGPAAEDEAALARVPARVELWQRLSQGVAAPPAGALEKARAAGAHVEAVVPDSPLLRVAFRGTAAPAGDGAVAALRGLRAHIAVLELGRSAITDRGLEPVREMSRLTHLDLHATAVTDAGIARLTGLRELRYLNLYETGVTDRALVALADLRTLEAVHLWQTRVTAVGAEALREELPAARVLLEPVLPEPAPLDGTAPPRRRRR